MKKEIGIGERRQEKKKRERERVKGDVVRGGEEMQKSKREERWRERERERERERGNERGIKERVCVCEREEKRGREFV